VRGLLGEIRSRSAPPGAEPERHAEAERGMRRRVVALARTLGDATAAARAVGLCERTARQWFSRWREDRLAGSRRGPRPRRASSGERLAVRAFLLEHGPGTGLERVRGAFGGLPFSEARRLKREWLAQRRRLLARRRAVLFWSRPGAVWAADFTDAPIEDGVGSLLLVRDLASGYTLGSGPCRRKDARSAHAALLALFLAHGAPLALKMDNAKAFRGRRVGALLGAFRVAALFSPRRRPSYNGSCERGIGWFKLRADHRAARGGRGSWSARDVEEARSLGNQTLRPWGACGPTPQDAFAGRRPLSNDERTLFPATVARYRDEEQSRRGSPRGGPRREAAERAAVRRALVDLHYLEINTRRVSPLIHSLIPANNS
jgi:hypothetical protein